MADYTLDRPTTFPGQADFPQPTRTATARPMSALPAGTALRAMIVVSALVWGGVVLMVVL